LQSTDIVRKYFHNPQKIKRREKRCRKKYWFSERTPDPIRLRLVKPMPGRERRLSTSMFCPILKNWTPCWHTLRESVKFR